MVDMYMKMMNNGYGKQNIKVQQSVEMGGDNP